MKNLIKFVLSLFIILSLHSCFSDLDSIPVDKDIVVTGIAYDNPDAYRAVLAKIYAGLAVTGQEGPAGKADIGGIDEGFGQYLRMYFYHQEFTTEEAINGWNDQTIKDFHDQTWTADDGFIYALYSRLFYQVAISNEFLRQTTDDKLNERGESDALKQEIQVFRAEARFLRALSYWHALDLFRNVPFVTENDPIGKFTPSQINAQDLFSFIESELLAIESTLLAPRTNEYARADQAAAWMLLAKLYQNANVYIGQDRASDCLTYCEKVINNGYELEELYEHLFLADNHNSDEIIFPIAFDGQNTKTWGGMTFIIRSALGGTYDAADSGVQNGWGGTRATRQHFEKFPVNDGGIVQDFNYGSGFSEIYFASNLNDFDGADGEDKLAKPSGSDVYEGYRYFPDDNNEVLFYRFPLAGQLGDDNNDGVLDADGARISVPESGLYRFQVNLNNNEYSVEKMEWSIVGSAVPGGALDMEYDSDKAILKVNADFMDGEFLFEQKAGFLTLGKSEDGRLAEFGNTIELSSGNYNIFIDLRKPNYAYQIATTNFDRRGIFYLDGQTIDIDDVSQFTQGVMVTKFKNITSDGQPGSDIEHADTDFPMFRLADAYLMAAESLVRLGSDVQKATDYFNMVRARAYNGDVANINTSDLTLDLILEERARELYWECHRRTDLIRHGKFSATDYLWQWKGGVKEGKSVEQFRDVFPIPNADISANPNLQQNDGY